MNSKPTKRPRQRHRWRGWTREKLVEMIEKTRPGLGTKLAELELNTLRRAVLDYVGGRVEYHVVSSKKLDALIKDPQGAIVKASLPETGCPVTIQALFGQTRYLAVEKVETELGIRTAALMLKAMCYSVAPFRRGLIKVIACDYLSGEHRRLLLPADYFRHFQGSEEKAKERLRQLRAQKPNADSLEMQVRDFVMAEFLALSKAEASHTGNGYVPYNPTFGHAPATRMSEAKNPMQTKPQTSPDVQ